MVLLLGHMPTPHIEAKPGDFAPTVLMPGDPLRAAHLAEIHLDDLRQVNGVRNMLAFTGNYRGDPVSVMGSGMGIPSISIYAKELYTEFGVQNIVRLGTCGAIRSDLQLRDLVIAMGASTDSGVNRTRFQGYDFAAIASPELLTAVLEVAREQSISVKVGNLFSSDLFYGTHPAMIATLGRMGVLAIEMEAAGLYGCAAECGQRALTICTVSDRLETNERLSTEDRRTSLDAMINLALASVVRFPS